MYLKTLTALGFKSFADKTALTFGPGMTAIVGPNGCGKSNVSDAIRWVLGEQSAKALRGGEMADVIFNGAESRKPMGLAEVSLTLGEMDVEPLRAAGIPVEYNEVTITRRVYRDGGSDYFLNRTACRLRDVQQLFAGTGLGKSSYSVMAQGNITQILSSKPEERRLVFEEAAGITRFRTQKREALRKLEATDQNLLRVEDLIREVKRQIGSLQRQAGKARRYQSIAAELRRLELQLARRQHDQLNAEVASRQAQADERRQVAEEAGVEVRQLEDEVARVRADLETVDRQASDAQRREMELRAEIERRQERIQFNQELRVELEGRARRANEEIAEAQERGRVSREELGIVEERLAAAIQRQSAAQAEFEVRRAGLTALETGLQQRQEGLRRAQAGSFDAAQRLARGRNEQNQWALRWQAAATRLEKLRAERGGLAEESSRLDTRLGEFHSAAAAGDLDIRTARERIDEAQSRLREIEEESRVAQQTLDAAQRRNAEIRTRLTVLEQLDAQREGFDAGAVAALRLAGPGARSLADRIRVAPAHVVSIEAALGRKVEMALASNAAAARTMIEALKRNGGGRASLGALDLSDLGPVQTPASIEGAVWGPSVVEADSEVRRLVDALLSSTFLVSNLETAIRLFSAHEGRWEFATDEGDLVTRGGVLHGGRPGQGKAGVGSVLARKTQIAELKVDGERASAEAAAVAKARAALQAEAASRQATVDAARQELRTHEMAVATRRGELNALQQARRALSQKVESVAYETQGLEAQEAEAIRRRDEIAAALAAIEAEQSAAEAQVLEESQGIEAIRRDRDAASSHAADAKVAAATESQIVQGLGRQRIPLEARLRELSTLVERLGAEIEGLGARRSGIASETEILWSDMDRLGHDREGAAQQAAALAGEKAALVSGLAGREERLKAARRRQAVAQAQRAELDVEIAQRASAAENLRARILERHQTRIDEVQGEGIRITLADEGQPKIEFISPDELALAGLSVDWDVVAARVKDLQRKLEDLGAVNLVAIDEFAEAEKRHEFLSRQIDELREAKKQLVEVLDKINDETRALFAQTFAQIRQNFQALFSEIFGGGKADLQLSDGEDPLEAGIDIVARPPGKQLQSITLLSGGEQTMTAVALLFSIYQVRPSPFCLLDELDAPLDESNINRFIKVLRRFLDHSQFVVITHNKRTIGMADAVYGVTMQEQGVSKIVGIKFDKAGQQPLPIALPATPALTATPSVTADVEVVLAK